MRMKRYSYFRSSAAYRVRIALNLKQLNAEMIPVHLLNNGGEQHSEAYRAVNPSELVPALVDDDFTLTQSLSILEYLEEKFPTHNILPQDLQQRALARAFSLSIACDIHPLNNLRVLQYLGGQLGATQEQKDAWYHHWIATGLQGLEAMLAGHPDTDRFCHGDTPTLADCCLVPQLFNARRFNCPLDAYPTLLRIDAACAELPAFQQAAPGAQADAE